MVFRSEFGKLTDERSTLLKKLVEVEMDGKSATEHMLKLRDTVRRLKEVCYLHLNFVLYNKTKTT